MSEQPTDFERRLAESLRTHVDRPELLASPGAVVAEVTSRPRRRSFTTQWLAAAGVAVLTVFAILVALLGPRLSNDPASDRAVAERTVQPATDRASPSEPPSPSPVASAMPSTTPRPDVDLEGRLAWNRMGEGCVLVVTDDGSSVGLGELPEGYQAVDDYPTAIVGPGGQPYASFDDRIGLKGRIDDAPGGCGLDMFAATEIVYLVPQPSPTPVDTIAGLLSGSRQLEGGCAWVRDESTGTSWEVTWPEGYWVRFEGDAPLLVSPSGDVVARQGDRIGLRGTDRSPLGSFCMVGTPFTATEISFIDRVPVSSEAILPGVTTLPDVSLSADGHEVELTSLRSLLLEGQEGWLPLDGRTLALAADPNNGRASVWLANLEEGAAHMIHPADVLEDVDADRQRLLVRTRSGFDLIARDGRLIATLANSDAADAVLLADGTIAITRQEDIGVWDPGPDSINWTLLPAGLEGASLIAVGSNVVAWEWHGGNVLLDPRTATEIGERWQAGSYAVAASRYGRHFVAHVYQSSGHVGRLELRDGLSGETLAVDEGSEMTGIDSIAWLTDDVILVMRKPAPRYEVSMPLAQAELHTVDDFARRVTVPPLVPNQSGVVQRGASIAVFGLSGEIVLMTASEGPG